MAVPIGYINVLPDEIYFVRGPFTNDTVLPPDGNTHAEILFVINSRFEAVDVIIPLVSNKLLAIKDIRHGNLVVSTIE